MLSPMRAVFSSPGARRRLAALLALVAVFGFAGRDLARHAHGFDEIDLRGHAIAAPAVPHELGAHERPHLEAARAGEHVACIDCVLQALARELSAAAPDISRPHAVAAAPAARPFHLRLAPSFEAATPRGPPSAA